MAGLTRVATFRLSLYQKNINLICIRSMAGGSPYVGGSPPNLTGGIFKEPSATPPPPHEEISEWVKKETGNNWKSLGYSQFDPKYDREMHHLMLFLTITCTLVLISFIYAYGPKDSFNDWYTREAYLLLREREAAGVEPVSKELIDPEKVLAALPSDEELKAAGVVINI
eukprot:TRINITY_DN9380_c0_g1_i2.p1 TRINITY_DN9380_c0_g1~~TRINITY_DN9380_c0_g1_i2.p1  ORF type:complete len:179 (-),score=25.36 TRINITY_DN9380_c0_g1_i2:232-738(-)